MVNIGSRDIDGFQFNATMGFYSHCFGLLEKLMDS